jgi:hypothetical protein
MVHTVIEVANNQEDVLAVIAEHVTSSLDTLFVQLMNAFSYSERVSDSSTAGCYL